MGRLWEQRLSDGKKQKSLELIRKAGDVRRESDILNNLGIVSKDMSRFAEALAYYESAQRIAQKIGDRSGEAMGSTHPASVGFEVKAYTTADGKLMVTRDPQEFAQAANQFVQSFGRACIDAGAISGWAGGPDASTARGACSFSAEGWKPAGTACSASAR